MRKMIMFTMICLIGYFGQKIYNKHVKESAEIKNNEELMASLRKDFPQFQQYMVLMKDPFDKNVEYLQMVYQAKKDENTGEIFDNFLSKTITKIKENDLEKFRGISIVVFHDNYKNAISLIAGINTIKKLDNYKTIKGIDQFFYKYCPSTDPRVLKDYCIYRR